MTRPLPFALVLAASLLLPRTAAAQWYPPPMPLGTGAPTQVISANPIGLMLEFYNAEYEVRINDSVTAGAGASRLGWGAFGGSGKPYLNGDVFVRFYPSGNAFNGLALGFKAGATRLREDGTFAGLGIDVNHSVAVNDHLVFSSGIGMKRLLRSKNELSTQVIVPTFRFNIGIGIP